MPLSTPLEELLSPERAHILAVLERTGQPLTGRQIAVLTGTVSQSTTSRQLLELGRRGIVTKVPGGYELNREHLAFRAIEALLDARHEFQRRVARHVEAWDSPPVSVVLFGSMARGEDTMTSDIDLLIVRPASVSFDDPAWASYVADLAAQVGRWCGSPCEVLEYSQLEIEQLSIAGDPLIESLRHEGVTMAGVDLRQILDVDPP